MLICTQAAAIATSAFVRPAALTALLAPPPSQAEATSPYRTVVEDEDEDEPGAAQRDLDARTPGFATAVDLDREAAQAGGDSLPALVARTPGATVRSVGGLGQFSSVSLRGSAPQQVAVFIDGVPVADAAAGIVDLGSQPIDGFGRLEIYRGYVPVAFGSAAIGGAIDLRGAPAWDGAGLTAYGGRGSFGASEVRAAVRGPLGKEQDTAGAITVGYAGATGDFRFVDDGGTPDLRGDDSITRRSNNDYDRVGVHGRLDHRRGPWRFAVQPIVVFKEQGVPGPAAAQSRAVRLSTTTARTIVTARRYDVGGPGGRVDWRLGLGVVHQRYRDPLGEVGLALDDQRQLGVDVYLSPRARLPLWRGAYLGLVADQRLEHLAVDQRAPTAGASGDAIRRRAAWGAGVELDQFLARGRVRVVPSIRIDALANRFAVPAGAGQVADQGRRSTTLGIAPRLGTRVRLWPGVELRGSGGRYFRPPNLTELFGNRGYLVGNEGLSAERGESVDGGLTVDRALGRRRPVYLYASVAGFATWSDDLIQWVNAGAVVRPTNIAGARIRGLESALALVPAVPYLTLHANYTRLDTRNDADDPSVRGRPLPGRPRHELWARGSAGLPSRLGRHELWSRLAYTVELQSGTALDPAERLVLPPRFLQGLGVELSLDQRIHLRADVRNLLDVRTTTATLAQVGGARPRATSFVDFLGYPLPGRSLWVSLRVDLDWTPS